MKIVSPSAVIVQAATNGDLAAMDQLLLTIQPGVFNLAVRMLGNRDDAADATQEILLKVVTHLSAFRGEAAFSTWVFQIARNQLLTAITRSKECPETSLDAMNERLQAGLDFSQSVTARNHGEQALTPEDKLEARQVALSCTQNMLMTMDRDQRLAYILDTVFGLRSRDAAEVLCVTPEAYRQRLARSRAKMDAFTEQTCGLVNADAACQCAKQLPALRHIRQVPKSVASASATVLAIHRSELVESERHFDSMLRMSDAAAVFRAHPEYRVPTTMHGAIRAVLKAEGLMADPRPLQ
jgi:RNA polymerase sigma factor (sigma-70 family)